MCLARYLLSLVITVIVIMITYTNTIQSIQPSSEQNPLLASYYIYIIYILYIFVIFSLEVDRLHIDLLHVPLPRANLPQWDPVGGAKCLECSSDAEQGALQAFSAFVSASGKAKPKKAAASKMTRSNAGHIKSGHRWSKRKFCKHIFYIANWYIGFEFGSRQLT